MQVYKCKKYNLLEMLFVIESESLLTYVMLYLHTGKCEAAYKKARKLVANEVVCEASFLHPRNCSQLKYVMASH